MSSSRFDVDNVLDKFYIAVAMDEHVIVKHASCDCINTPDACCEAIIADRRGRGLEVWQSAEVDAEHLNILVFGKYQRPQAEISKRIKKLEDMAWIRVSFTGPSGETMHNSEAALLLTTS